MRSRGSGWTPYYYSQTFFTFIMFRNKHCSNKHLLAPRTAHGVKLREASKQASTSYEQNNGNISILYFGYEKTLSLALLPIPYYFRIFRFLCLLFENFIKVRNPHLSAKMKKKKNEQLPQYFRTLFKH